MCVGNSIDSISYRWVHYPSYNRYFAQAPTADISKVIESFDRELATALACGPPSISKDVKSCIYYSRMKGYHVYKELWPVAVGETSMLHGDD